MGLAAARGPSVSIDDLLGRLLDCDQMLSCRPAFSDNAQRYQIAKAVNHYLRLCLPFEVRESARDRAQGGIDRSFGRSGVQTLE